VRRKELGVRSALGASRASLIRQLLLEGWILAIAGGAIGLVAAWLSVDAVLASYPVLLPRASEVQIDARIVAVAAVLTWGVGLAVAWLPAIRLTRQPASADVIRGDRRTSAAIGVRAERVLVIGQLAVSAAVAVGALLLTESFVRLSRVPLGFDPERVTAVTVGVGRAPGRDARWPQEVFAALTQRLAASPGIAAAGAMSSLPLLNPPPPDLYTIEGRPVPPPSRPGLIADYVMVTPGTFDALGMRIVRGRAINTQDTPGAAPVAVINERLARSQWPDADPVGTRIRYPEGVEGDRWTAWGPWISIVGIVGDIRSITPAAEPRPAIYVAHGQRPRRFYEGRTMAVVVRGATADVDVAGPLRAHAAAVDPMASLSAVRPLATIAGAAVARPRFLAGIMTLFAAVALVVASLGVYGVVTYMVDRRTRDIGVQLALGATRARIARNVVRHTAALLAGGVIAGITGAMWLAGSLEGLLFGVNPWTVTPYMIVTATLALTVIAAIARPVRRAMRIDPVTAMRAE
jgi:predicted permease